MKLQTILTTILLSLMLIFSVCGGSSINPQEKMNATTNNLISIKLSISNSSLQLDADTTLNAIATYKDNTTKDVTEEVEWISSDSNAIEIIKRRLKAKKEKNVILRARLNAITSNVVTLEIYKEINGHRLPPEPNKTLNDSTLLGIDINNNGVRDDVERWIYETYKDKHPIHIDIAMQAGRAWQKVLEDPSKAKETSLFLDAAQGCGAYYQIYAKYFNEPILVGEIIITKDYREKVTNTNLRRVNYWQYDTLLSGGVYNTPKIGEGKKLCDFNTSKYEE